MTTLTFIFQMVLMISIFAGFFIVMRWIFDSLPFAKTVSEFQYIGRTFQIVKSDNSMYVFEKTSYFGRKRVGYISSFDRKTPERVIEAAKKSINAEYVFEKAEYETTNNS